MQLIRNVLTTVSVVALAACLGTFVNSHLLLDFSVGRNQLVYDYELVVGD